MANAHTRVTNSNAMGSRSLLRSSEAIQVTKGVSSIRKQKATSDITLLDKATSTAKVILDCHETKSVHDPQKNPASVKSLADSPQSGNVHTAATSNLIGLSPMARWESETTRDQPWNAIEAFAPAYDIEVIEFPLQDEHSTLSTRGQNGSAVASGSCKDEY
jgi:hypothetical protein